MLVVIFTVYRTARIAIESRKAKLSGSLSFLLLRDGEDYQYCTLTTDPNTCALCFIRIALLRVGLHLYIALLYMTENAVPFLLLNS